MSLSRSVLAFLVVGFIGQIVYYYPNLPEKMASHFDIFGEPDRWLSKSSFMMFEFVILFLIIAEFTLLPSLLEKMPDSLINFPNKEYWLAKERRGETFIYLQNYFEWFSVGLLALFISINEFVFRSNLSRQNLQKPSGF